MTAPRLFQLVGLAFVVTATADVASATARGVTPATTYPWCAHYMMANGPHNCGFVTFEQCLATVRGIGGTCQMNPAAASPTDVPRQRQRKRARNA